MQATYQIVLWFQRNLAKNTILEEFAGPPQTGVYSPSVQVSCIWQFSFWRHVQQQWCSDGSVLLPSVSGHIWIPNLASQVSWLWIQVMEFVLHVLHTKIKQSSLFAWLSCIRTLCTKQKRRFWTAFLRLVLEAFRCSLKTVKPVLSRQPELEENWNVDVHL